MPAPLVKICGITNVEDALFCANAGTNFLGFIFYTKSPRYISPEDARKIIANLPSSVTPVGVFVNESHESINEIIHLTKIQIIQLSGDESPDECSGYPLDVWKAFRLSSIEEIKQTEEYKISALLLDGVKGKEYGGTGVLANIAVAKELQKEHRLVLAGGLHPDNICTILQEVQPYVLDVNSGVESSPGKKDYTKVTQLFENLSTHRK